MREKLLASKNTLTNHCRWQKNNLCYISHWCTVRHDQVKAVATNYFNGHMLVRCDKNEIEILHQQLPLFLVIFKLFLLLFLVGFFYAEFNCLSVTFLSSPQLISHAILGRVCQTATATVSIQFNFYTVWIIYLETYS